MLHYYEYSTKPITTVDSRYVKLDLLEIFPKFRFKLSAFQLNVLLLSKISMSRKFGYLEAVFQSLTYKSIHIMFVISKLLIKSINKPVKVSKLYKHTVVTNII